MYVSFQEQQPRMKDACTTCEGLLAICAQALGSRGGFEKWWACFWRPLPKNFPSYPFYLFIFIFFFCFSFWSSSIFFENSSLVFSVCGFDRTVAHYWEFIVVSMFILRFPHFLLDCVFFFLLYFLFFTLLPRLALEYIYFTRSNEARGGKAAMLLAKGVKTNGWKIAPKKEDENVAMRRAKRIPLEWKKGVNWITTKVRRSSVLFLLLWAFSFFSRHFVVDEDACQTVFGFTDRIIWWSF